MIFASDYDDDGGLNGRKHHHSLCNFMFFIWRENSFILNTIFLFFLSSTLHRETREATSNPFTHTHTTQHFNIASLFVSKYSEEMKLDHENLRDENWVATLSCVRLDVRRLRRNRRENNLIHFI
jgi:hypothetical protein